MTTNNPDSAQPESQPDPQPRKPRRRGRTSLIAHGEPMVWLIGGTLVIAVAMVLCLLILVLYRGGVTFWPQPVVKVQTHDGRTLMGEITRVDTYQPTPEAIETFGPDADLGSMRTADGDITVERRLMRTGNFRITGDHFNWVATPAIKEQSYPEWAVTVERLEWGRFYGELTGLKVDDELVTDSPEEAWERFEQAFPQVRERYFERRSLETHETGEINFRIERARLKMREAELDDGEDSPAYAEARERFEQIEKEGNEAFKEIRQRIDALNTENARMELVFDTAQDVEVEMPLADIVRAYPANQVSESFAASLGVYLSRWKEFLTAEPREANSEGGVFPAIFGTVLMTLIMCVLVVPFGVLAALYMREYAKSGPIISTVRIAINNLAGVPSIVFGVFGLGFFCYLVGGSVDQLFFEAKLPNPTFGTSGLIWASFTLALLTLPVVIVATEEALAAVPNSMREGSYACGASKWQTIRRIVMPRAMPGVMTGAILAMARGAGEVAPLMLVGAVKLAPELPLSFKAAEQFGVNRSFMHLGFHIYDVGFQSQNSEAAKPMVFTTTLLLIAIVFILNVSAIALRSRLRRKFQSSAF